MSCNIAQAAASAAGSDSEQSTLGGYASADGDAGGDDRPTLWPLSRSRSRCGPALSQMGVRTQRSCGLAEAMIAIHRDLCNFLERTASRGWGFCSAIVAAVALMTLSHSWCRTWLYTVLALTSSGMLQCPSIPWACFALNNWPGMVQRWRHLFAHSGCSEIILSPHCGAHTFPCLSCPYSAAGFAAQQGGPDPRSPASAPGPTPQQHAFSTAPVALLQPGTPPASPPMSPPRRATGPPANSVPQTEGRPLHHVRSLAAAQVAQQPDDGEASHAILGSVYRRGLYVSVQRGAAEHWFGTVIARSANCRRGWVFDIVILLLRRWQQAILSQGAGGGPTHSQRCALLAG